MNDNLPITPVGTHDLDPPIAEVDPVLYALERLQTLLIWMDEHRQSFENFCRTDPPSAANELRYLQNATEQAVLHLQRLTELTLAGYKLDPLKQRPKGLCTDVWRRLVEIIQREHHGTRNN